MPNLTNTGFNIPTVGGDRDTWGTELNTLFSDFDGIWKGDGTGTSVGGNIGAGKVLMIAGEAKFANTSLKILDTNGSHYLTIAAGSNITASRTLTLTTGDASRTITLSGNPTLADWFNQSVKTTNDVLFNSQTLTAGRLETGLVGLINDDSVASITPPAVSVYGVMFFWAATPNVAAMIVYDTDSSPSVLMQTVGSLVDVVTASALSGTTGTDGRVRIAINNGEIKIENRRGGAMSYKVMFMAG